MLSVQPIKDSAATNAILCNPWVHAKLAQDGREPGISTTRSSATTAPT